MSIMQSLAAKTKVFFDLRRALKLSPTVRVFRRLSKRSKRASANAERAVEAVISSEKVVEHSSETLAKEEQEINRLLRLIALDTSKYGEYLDKTLKGEDLASINKRSTNAVSQQQLEHLQKQTDELIKNTEQLINNVDKTFNKNISIFTDRGTRLALVGSKVPDAIVADLELKFFKKINARVATIEHKIKNTTSAEERAELIYELKQLTDMADLVNTEILDFINATAGGERSLSKKLYVNLETAKSCYEKFELVTTYIAEKKDMLANAQVAQREAGAERLLERQFETEAEKLHHIVTILGHMTDNVQHLSKKVVKRLSDEMVKGNAEYMRNNDGSINEASPVLRSINEETVRFDTTFLTQLDAFKTAFTTTYHLIDKDIDNDMNTIKRGLSERIEAHEALIAEAKQLKEHIHNTHIPELKSKLEAEVKRLESAAQNEKDRTYADSAIIRTGSNEERHSIEAIAQCAATAAVTKSAWEKFMQWYEDGTTKSKAIPQTPEERKKFSSDDYRKNQSGPTEKTMMDKLKNVTAAGLAAVILASSTIAAGTGGVTVNTKTTVTEGSVVQDADYHRHVTAVKKAQEKLKERTYKIARGYNKVGFVNDAAKQDFQKAYAEFLQEVGPHKKVIDQISISFLGSADQTRKKGPGMEEKNLQKFGVGGAEAICNDFTRDIKPLADKMGIKVDVVNVSGVINGDPRRENEENDAIRYDEWGVRIKSLPSDIAKLVAQDVSKHRYVLVDAQVKIKDGGTIQAPSVTTILVVAHPGDFPVERGQHIEGRVVFSPPAAYESETGDAMYNATDINTPEQFLENVEVQLWWKIKGKVQPFVIPKDAYHVDKSGRFSFEFDIAHRLQEESAERVEKLTNLPSFLTAYSAPNVDFDKLPQGLLVVAHVKEDMLNYKKGFYLHVVETERCPFGRGGMGISQGIPDSGLEDGASTLSNPRCDGNISGIPIRFGDLAGTNEPHNFEKGVIIPVFGTKIEGKKWAHDKHIIASKEQRLRYNAGTGQSLRSNKGLGTNWADSIGSPQWNEQNTNWNKLKGLLGQTKRGSLPDAAAFFARNLVNKWSSVAGVLPKLDPAKLLVNPRNPNSIPYFAVSAVRDAAGTLQLLKNAGTFTEEDIQLIKKKENVETATNLLITLLYFEFSEQVEEKPEENPPVPTKETHEAVEQATAAVAQSSPTEPPKSNSLVRIAWHLNVQNDKTRARQFNTTWFLQDLNKDDADPAAIVEILENAIKTKGDKHNVWKTENIRVSAPAFTKSFLGKRKNIQFSHEWLDTLYELYTNGTTKDDIRKAQAEVLSRMKK